MTGSFRVMITSRPHLFVLQLLLLCHVTQWSEARHWTEVVNPMVYRFPGLDADRFLLKQEANPLQFAASERSMAPSSSPSSSTLTPTSSTTATPTTTSPTTTAPTTTAPTAMVCPHPQNEQVFELKLMDTWGDGWDSTRIVILGPSPMDGSIMSQPNTASTIQETHTATTTTAPDATTTTQEGEGPTTTGDTPVDPQDSTTTTLSQVVTLEFPDASPPESLPPLDPSTTSWIHTTGSSVEVVFNGTLDNGHVAFHQLCLQPDTCYHVTVEGGNWEQDVCWELRLPFLESTNSIQQQPQQGGGGDPTSASVNYLSLVSNGWAPVSCQFSFGPISADDTVLQESTVIHCPNTCRGELRPTTSPTQAPTQTTAPTTPSPSRRPTHTPSVSPPSALLDTLSSTNPTPSLSRTTLTPSNRPTSAPVPTPVPTPAPQPRRWWETTDDGVVAATPSATTDDTVASPSVWLTPAGEYYFYYSPAMSPAAMSAEWTPSSGWDWWYPTSPTTTAGGV